MQVKILDIATERVSKGAGKGYSVAVVAYTYNGEARTQKVVDFANPAVFKALPSFLGRMAEVTTTKNDAGYNQWAAIEEVGAAPTASTTTISAPPGGNPAPVRVTGSNYETPVERAQKQVYIVKQSSIANAIALAEATKVKASPEDIIAVAQQFVDYVFDTPKVDKSIEGMTDDIPY